MEGWKLGLSIKKSGAECGMDVACDQFGRSIEQNYYMLTMLHELGHALLEHINYNVDLERVKMERAAWGEGEGAMYYI